MKLLNLKYLFVICITIPLLLKVGHVVSYLKYSSITIESTLVQDDATEKEDKKIETEYFTDHFFYAPTPNLFLITKPKLIAPDTFFQRNYFPEVSTPPPLIVFV